MTAAVIVVIVIVVLLAACLGLCFLLGFRLGDGGATTEMLEVRLRAAEARRRLHELTREAFIAMAEEAQRRQNPPSGPSDGSGNRR